MEAAARMMPIESAEDDLKRQWSGLRLGETIMLLGSGGVPEALLVSLKSALDRPLSTSDWQRQWDILADKVSQAWKGDKSAAETLAEMRR